MKKQGIRRWLRIWTLFSTNCKVTVWQMKGLKTYLRYLRHFFIHILRCASKNIFHEGSSPTEAIFRISTNCSSCWDLWQIPLQIVLEAFFIFNMIHDHWICFQTRGTVACSFWVARVIKNTRRKPFEFKWPEMRFNKLSHAGQNYWTLIGWDRGHFFLIKRALLVIKRAWLLDADWLSTPALNWFPASNGFWKGISETHRFWVWS